MSEAANPIQDWHIEDIMNAPATKVFRYTTPHTGQKIALVPIVLIDTPRRLRLRSLASIKECAADGSTRLNLDNIWLGEVVPMIKAWSAHSNEVMTKGTP